VPETRPHDVSDAGALEISQDSRPNLPRYLDIPGRPPEEATSAVAVGCADGPARMC